MVLERNIEVVFRAMKNLAEHDRTIHNAMMKSGFAPGTTYAAVSILVERKKLDPVRIGNTRLYKIVVNGDKI